MVGELAIEQGDEGYKEDGSSLLILQKDITLSHSQHIHTFSKQNTKPSFFQAYFNMQFTIATIFTMATAAMAAPGNHLLARGDVSLPL